MITISCFQNFSKEALRKVARLAWTVQPKRRHRFAVVIVIAVQLMQLGQASLRLKTTYF